MAFTKRKYAKEDLLIAHWRRRGTTEMEIKNRCVGQSKGRFTNRVAENSVLPSKM